MQVHVSCAMSADEKISNTHSACPRGVIGSTMGVYPRGAGSNPVEGNGHLFSLILSALSFVFLWHASSDSAEVLADAWRCGPADRSWSVPCMIISLWSWRLSVWSVCFDWCESCLPSWCNRKHDGRLSRRREWALLSLVPSALSFVFLWHTHTHTHTHTLEAHTPSSFCPFSHSCVRSFPLIISSSQFLCANLFQGACGFKHSKKSTGVAAHTVGERIAEVCCFAYFYTTRRIFLRKVWCMEPFLQRNLRRIESRRGPRSSNTCLLNACNHP